MASKNNLINFNTGGKNRLPDSQLNAEWGEGGIGKNEVAYSTLLNTLLIQMNQVTQSVANLVVDKVDNITLNSDESPLTYSILEEALNKIVTERAPDKRKNQTKNTIWAAPGAADGLPGFRSLVVEDIPNNLPSAKIKDNAIVGSKISNSAVTVDKIANLAVTNEKLGEDSVTASKIKDGAITNVKIAEGAVISSKIKDGAVTDAKIENASKFGSIVGIGGDNNYAEYKVRILSQPQYDAISSKDANTLYFIK